MTAPAFGEAIRRDQYGRPYIKQEDGGEVAYTRVTTLAGCYEDQSNLAKWKVRNALLGVAKRDDLLLGVRACTPDDKRTLNDLAEKAQEAGGASEKATIGTAVHRFAERLDAGEQFDVPTEVAADLAAYRKVMEPFEVVASEQFVVCDELQVAGTFDRLLILTVNGKRYIGDLKTGSVGFLAKMAAQLAIYAHSEVYDPESGERTPLDVDRETGVIIHVPAGEGRAELVWLDLAAGWDDALLSRQVHVRRKFDDYRVNQPAELMAARLHDGVVALIQQCSSEAECLAVWGLVTSAGLRWTDEHTAAVRSLLAVAA